MIRHLAGSIIFSLILIGGSYTLYNLSQQRLVKAQIQHAALRTDAHDINQRLQRTQQDEPAVRIAISRFEALSNLGVIGPERRLEWSDQVKLIEQNLHITDARYTLSPQKQIMPVQGATSYNILGSSMQWHASLLHEGDLVRFLAALPEITSAVVVPSRCTLTDRSSQSTVGSSIDADCQFDWLTVAPAQLTKTATP
ncbi:hypothetical protein [Uliginosibacterium gangwonense]|uniref:hypothetical protein n=1 Tax=Uliginosibacterium gangwonense TaxID=392736 RepID=UPI000373CBCF|nr:hypothetical protein [Uliginosibacterium gangwonense]